MKMNVPSCEYLRCSKAADKRIQLYFLSFFPPWGSVY